MICPQQNLLSLPLPLLNSDLDLNKWIQHTNPMPYSYIVRPHSMLPVVVLSPIKNHGVSGVTTVVTWEDVEMFFAAARRGVPCPTRGLQKCSAVASGPPRLHLSGVSGPAKQLGSKKCDARSAYFEVTYIDVSVLNV